MRFSLTISRYLIGAVLPYFVFSWLLLSVILFVQQASRFADIFFSANIPANLVWQLTLALVPNVIAFTCPMAVLVGVIIGLSKMQGDSELVAIRAAGVGNTQITLPIVVIGIALSLFALFINLYGVPFAARVVRQVAIQTAIYKLESPIEPGVFNTEIAGYTIYVKDGDLTDGQWKNIFVHNEDEKTGNVRLITSTRGRIDSSGEQSELVLENAVATTFNNKDDDAKLVSERIGEARFAIKTRRGELIQRLSSTELTPEELGLAQLSEYAEKREGRERTEAEILRYRRLILSITPLIFCLLGTALVLRFNRGGRGFGIVIALGSLIGYYLLAFLGEQLARTDAISVAEGSAIPMIGSALAIVWFNVSNRIEFLSRAASFIREKFTDFDFNSIWPRRANRLIDITTGIRDFDLIETLVKYYVFTVIFLAVVFLIFTAFELWRFAGVIDGGVFLLSKYLFFLLPFVYLQLAPSAAMIATLATYVIKSRQNEIVTWTSAGLSIYRLLLPCFALMVFFGAVNWQIQELVAPAANRRQDELRTQIRNRGVVADRPGRYWVANDRAIYSFSLDGASNTAASDNATQSIRSYLSPRQQSVSNLRIYEFADNWSSLQALYRAGNASWDGDRIRFIGPVRKTTLGPDRAVTVDKEGGEFSETGNPFAQARAKPSHLASSQLRLQEEGTESDVERRAFGVALQKRYATIFLPLVIALFTTPFALSLSRKGKAATIGYAVALWLVYMGFSGTFEQLGMNGYMSPAIAVWAPLLLFSLLGVYLISRIRT